MGKQEQEREMQKADGHEPDYRFTLSNERTHLAWMRTSLALLAGGILVDELTPTLMLGYSRMLAFLLVLISIACATGATLRWQRIQRAMRHDEPLPVAKTPWVLAASVIVFGIYCIVTFMFAH